MQFSFAVIASMASLLLSSACSGYSTNQPSQPIFSHVFTASLSLGKPLKPINAEGGALLIEPITNGSISGSGFNGIITGGVAYPTFYDNMKYEQPDIVVYGTTDKSGSFFALLTGVGSSTAQNTRVTIQASPPYAYLNETFVLGHIARGESGSVTVEAYIVK